MCTVFCDNRKSALNNIAMDHHPHQQRQTVMDSKLILAEELLAVSEIIHMGIK